MIIVAVEESSFLLAVGRVVSGIEVEHQVLGWLGMGGDELVDEDGGDANQRLAVDAVLEAANGWRRGKVASSSGGFPEASWRAGSARRV